MNNHKSQQKFKSKYFLAGILWLALGLRVILISRSPPSLYWEEVALGYDAYSILKTGKDYHGNPWPLVAFESFGDWKPSGYFYTLVPFIALFGLNDGVVRLPSVLAGTLTVGLVYLIVREVSQKKAWALWSALMLSIMPWHIQFSRAAFEVNLATCFLTLGVYLFLKSRKKPYWLIGAVVAMTVAMYTYHGLRVLAPLLSISLILIDFKVLKRSKYLWLSGLLVLGLCLPLLRAWDSPQIQQRFNETSLFSTSAAVPITNRERAEDGNTWLARAIHHRYWFWGQEILKGSLVHLNPTFLFLTGDQNPRHQTGRLALLYPWMILPLLIGLQPLVFGKERSHWWILLWIGLATIPPALTNVTPHTLRFLPAAPAFAMIIGLGMKKISDIIQKQKMTKWLYGFVVLVMAGSVMIYLYDLWWVYPKRSSQEWQFGYKEAMQSIKNDYLDGKQIYFTNSYGRASIYALWYLKIDPRLVQAWDATLPHDQGELLALPTMNFYYPGGMINQITVTNNEQLIGRLRQKISFLDGKPAFFIYDN